MPVDLEAVESRAKAATKGPWHVGAAVTIRVGDQQGASHPCGSSRPIAVVDDPPDSFRAECGMGTLADDRAYIALMHPGTALEMVGMLRRLRAFAELCARDDTWWMNGPGDANGHRFSIQDQAKDALNTDGRGGGR